MKSNCFILFIFTIANVANAQSSFPLIEINDVSKTIIKEIRYATVHNFVGNKIDGYIAPKCFLTESAANALGRVQNKLKKLSLSLKVFDCYRPQRAVNNFVDWANSKARDSTKKYYFPNVPSEKLFEFGYIAKKSGHSRGSTVDLTIVGLPYQSSESYNYNCLDPEGYLYRGSELNMGTGFDCFDVKSHTSSPEIGKNIIKNRKLLLEVMEEEGFVNYSKEWWHFTYKPEDYPNTYFDFVIE